MLYYDAVKVLGLFLAFMHLQHLMKASYFVHIEHYEHW